jgi:hypothetical protein
MKPTCVQELFSRELIQHRSFIGNYVTIKNASAFVEHNCKVLQYVTWMQFLHNLDHGEIYITYISPVTGKTVTYSITFHDIHDGPWIFKDRIEKQNNQRCVIRWKRFYPESIDELIKCLEEREKHSLLLVDNPYNYEREIKLVPFDRFDNRCSVMCENNRSNEECQKTCNKSRQPWSLMKLSGTVINSYFAGCITSLGLPSILEDYLYNELREKVFEPIIEYDEDDDESDDENDDESEDDDDLCHCYDDAY